MSIYGKNTLKLSYPEPAGHFPRNLECSIMDSCPVIGCSNDVPGVTLTYFVTRSNYVT